MLFLKPGASLPMQVIQEIRKHHPEFRATEDSGYQGRRYWYYVVDLTEQELTLFALRWGEYFAV